MPHWLCCKLIIVWNIFLLQKGDREHKIDTRCGKALLDEDVDQVFIIIVAYVLTNENAMIILDMKLTLSGLWSSSLKFLGSLSLWLITSLVWKGESNLGVLLLRCAVFFVIYSTYSGSRISSITPKIWSLFRRPYCSMASRSLHGFHTNLLDQHLQCPLVHCGLGLLYFCMENIYTNKKIMVAGLDNPNKFGSYLVFT